MLSAAVGSAAICHEVRRKPASSLVLSVRPSLSLAIPLAIPQSGKSDEEEAQVARGLGFDPYAFRRA